MHSAKPEVALPLARSTELTAPGRIHRRWWSLISAGLVAAIFLQAVFAGAMLSGVEWAAKAHSANAILLVASTVAAGLAAILTLRRTAGGPRLALLLLALAVTVFLQTAIGTWAAAGANLLWLHIPLGVALVGFASQAVTGARRLGGQGHGGSAKREPAREPS